MLKFSEKKYLIFLNTGNLLLGSVYTVLNPFYPIIAKKHGLSDSIIGLSLSFNAIAGIITSFYGDKILNSFNPKSVYLFSNLVLTICLISFGLANYVNNTFIYALINCLNRFIQGITVNISFIYAFSCVSNFAKNNEFKKYIAFAEGTLTFGMILGPILGSVFYTYFGYEGVFISLAFLVLFFTIIIAFINIKHENNCLSILNEEKNLKKDIEEKFEFKSEEEITNNNELSFITILLEKKVLLTFIYVSFFGILIAFFIVPDFSMYLKKKFFLKDYMISILFSIQSLVYFIGTILFVYLTKYTIEDSVLLQIGCFISFIGGVFLAASKICGILINFFFFFAF